MQKDKKMTEEEFRDLCRCYHTHADRLEKMNRASVRETQNTYGPWICQKEWMKEHVEKVERLFDIIEQNYGVYARAMLWEYYVDGMKQPDIAYKYGIPLRTMQRRFSRWIGCVTEKLP